jgi:hypothetical protein
MVYDPRLWGEGQIGFECMGFKPAGGGEVEPWSA